METGNTSEIEKIIKEKIDEETQKSIAQLNEQIESQTQQAIERINNVYASAISTLRKLELTDATIFDFFQKTNGNIRVYEIQNRWEGRLDVSKQDGTIQDRNPIRLQDNTNYKIILMAIKVEEKSG